MKAASIAALVYGFLVLAGGVFGYLQAKSFPSLVSGVACGLILLGTGAYLWQGSIAAGYVAGGLALFLALFFAYRFTITGKFMPGGLMLALSFIMVVVLVVGMFTSLRR